MSPAAALALAVELITQGMKISQLVQASHAAGRGGDLTPEQKKQVRDDYDDAIARLEQALAAPDLAEGTQPK